MIPIVKPAAPAVLLDKGVPATRAMCDAFRAAPREYRSGTAAFEFDRTIYAADAAKDALRTAQHNKCAFCESYVPHISYGDVEHFRPKAGYRQKPKDKLRRPGYYWLAYAWENLFFCCQLCNQRFKGNLFPLRDGRRRARSHAHDLAREEPLLIDPTRLDPTDFIEFREEQAYAVGECSEGKATIEVLGLNRSELVEARARRLKNLRWLVLTRDLLRKEIASAPTPALADQLRAVEQTLRESSEATGDYAAMARAFLDRPIPAAATGLSGSR